MRSQYKASHLTTKTVATIKNKPLPNQYIMKDPNKNSIKTDPATVLLIISILILAPLLLTGFFSQ
jgi:hypothetical protein